jgi:hypothetical protein
MTSHTSTDEGRVKRALCAVHANAPLLSLGVLLALSLLTRCSPHNQSGAVSTSGPGGAGGAGNAAATECSPATVDRDCPLPPSTCSDEFTLVFYNSPTCVGGVCQWQGAAAACPGETCSNGACGGLRAPTGGSGGGTSSAQDAGVGGQPFATCTVNPGDSGAAGDSSASCELPSSVCADSDTLLYFTNPHCVQGACQADVHSESCGPSGCSNGGCYIVPTK